MSDAVRNNTTESRFELDVNGHTALAFYRMEPGVITFLHTEVPRSYLAAAWDRALCAAPWKRSAGWG
jgi:predicted GNAT family acetyltransferase